MTEEEIKNLYIEAAMLGWDNPGMRVHVMLDSSGGLRIRGYAEGQSICRDDDKEKSVINFLTTERKEKTRDEAIDNYRKGFEDVDTWLYFEGVLRRKMLAFGFFTLAPLYIAE